MSFPCSDFSDQYKTISQYAKDFSGEVVLETNKRVVVRFNADADARSFAYNLRHQDFACAVRPGLKTDARYAQVVLKYPY